MDDTKNVAVTIENRNVTQKNAAQNNRKYLK